MLQIENVVVSLDIFEKKFVCDLKKCKGACCVLGDSGAPLEKEEAEILKTNLDRIIPFMRPEGIKSVESQGTHVIDSDGDLVTPLIDGKECAFVVFDHKVAKCAIEMAWEEKKIDFRKPVSCHLYPIRITPYSNFDALNFHEWEICQPACKNGQHLQVPVYVFLEQPLKRKYGEKWYNQVKLAAEELRKFKASDSK